MNGSNRRLVITGYKDPEKVHWDETPIPEPSSGEVLIRNRAIGVNPADWKTMDGHFAQFMHDPFPFVLGSASAGVIVGAGAGVEGLAVGDEVIAHSIGGAYQEYRVADASEVVRKPRSIDVQSAAAISGGVMTGYVLVDQADIAPGDTLLIHAGAGQVGSAAAQLAIARGATVIGTASPANHEYLRGIGVTPVAYGPNLLDAVRSAGSVTVVIDAAGGEENVAVTTALVGPGGRAVTAVSDPFSTAAGIRPVGRRASALAVATELVASHVVRVRHAGSLPFEQALDALAASRTGHVGGKLTLLTADR